MKKVLVTGASGFVGRPCLPLLAAAGYEVHAVARVPLSGIEVPICWHQCDLLVPGQAAALIARVQPTHLLHLAWVTTPGTYWNSAENHRWLQASLDLAQTFARHRGCRAVLTGSCAEYAWGDGPCREDTTPLAPTSVYGTCKRDLAQQAHVTFDAAGVSFAWARLFFLYGPHERPERLVPSVIGSLRRGERARCTHGRQVRDFLHVEDAAAALVRVLDSQLVGPINVASGAAVSVREVVETIGDLLNRREWIELGAIPAPEGEPLSITADVTRLRDELKWSPRYDLASGLQQTIDWWCVKT